MQFRYIFKNGDTDFCRANNNNQKLNEKNRKIYLRKVKTDNIKNYEHGN